MVHTTTAATPITAITIMVITAITMLTAVGMATATTTAVGMDLMVDFLKPKQTGKLVWLNKKPLEMPKDKSVDVTAGDFKTFGKRL